MEWLKELLEGAKITDGKLNVDEVMESVKKEFPKHAVPKNGFTVLRETPLRFAFSRS